MCEIPEAINRVERKARKEHRCCECGGTINKGDKYIYTSGIWCGQPESFKQCLICDEIMTAVVNFNDYDGAGFGEVRAWFEGFVCRDFSGEKWLTGMAEDVDIDPEKLNHLLRVR